MPLDEEAVAEIYREHGPMRRRVVWRATIPLALKSAGGWAFAGLFAVGSSLPLLAVAAHVTTGTGAVEVLAGSLRRLERPVRVIAAAVLMIAGLHDTLVYWTL